MWYKLIHNVRLKLSPRENAAVCPVWTVSVRISKMGTRLRGAMEKAVPRMTRPFRARVCSVGTRATLAAWRGSPAGPAYALRKAPAVRRARVRRARAAASAARRVIALPP